MKIFITLLMVLIASSSFLIGQDGGTNGSGNSLTSLSPSFEQKTLLIEYREEDEALVDAIFAQIQSQVPIERLYTTPILKTQCWKFDKFHFNLNFGGEIFTSTDIIEANDNIKKSRGNNGTAGTGGDIGFGNDGLNMLHRIGMNPNPTPSISARIPCASDYNLYIPLDGSPVKVAILDSGFKSPEETNAHYPFPQENFISSKNYIVDDYDVWQPGVDDHNHGTQILSIINGVAHSMQNFAPGLVTFDIRKTLDKDGLGNLGNVLLATEEAILDGAQIINMSFGYASVNMGNTLITKLFELAEEENVLLVVAAGNGYLDMGYNIGESYYMPASLQGDNVITVGSIGCGDRTKSTFSNFNNGLVDVATIGEKVPGYGIGGYLYASDGTSQATAVVSGVATMLASIQNVFNASQIKCAIVEGAVKVGSLSGYFANGNTLDGQGARANLSITCSGESYPGDPDHGIGMRSLETSGQELLVFPNPFSEQFQYSLDVGEYDISIQDILGNIVFSSQKSIQNNAEIVAVPSSTKWTNGVYIITAINQLGERQSLKFMKQ